MLPRVIYHVVKKRFPVHAVSGMENDWWKKDVKEDFRIESCPFFNVTLLFAAATELKLKLNY